MIADDKDIAGTRAALGKIRSGKGRIKGWFWLSRAPKSRSPEEEPILIVSLQARDQSGGKVRKAAQKIRKKIGRTRAAQGEVIFDDGKLVFDGDRKFTGFKACAKMLAKAYKFAPLAAAICTVNGGEVEQGDDVEIDETVSWIQDAQDAVGDVPDVAIADMEDDAIDAFLTENSDNLANLNTQRAAFVGQMEDDELVELSEGAIIRQGGSAGNVVIAFIRSHSDGVNYVKLLKRFKALGAAKTDEERLTAIDALIEAIESFNDTNPDRVQLAAKAKAALLNMKEPLLERKLKAVRDAGEDTATLEGELETLAGEQRAAQSGVLDNYESMVAFAEGVQQTAIAALDKAEHVLATSSEPSDRKKARKKLRKLEFIDKLDDVQVTIDALMIISPLHPTDETIASQRLVRLRSLEQANLTLQRRNADVLRLQLSERATGLMLTTLQDQRVELAEALRLALASGNDSEVETQQQALQALETKLNYLSAAGRYDHEGSGEDASEEDGGTGLATDLHPEITALSETVSGLLREANDKRLELSREGLRSTTKSDRIEARKTAVASVDELLRMLKPSLVLKDSDSATVLSDIVDSDEHDTLIGDIYNQSTIAELRQRLNAIDELLGAGGLAQADVDRLKAAREALRESLTPTELLSDPDPDTKVRAQKAWQRQMQQRLNELRRRAAAAKDDASEQHKLERLISQVETSIQEAREELRGEYKQALESQRDHAAVAAKANKTRLTELNGLLVIVQRDEEAARVAIGTGIGNLTDTGDDQKLKRLWSRFTTAFTENNSAVDAVTTAHTQIDALSPYVFEEPARANDTLEARIQQLSARKDQITESLELSRETIEKQQLYWAQVTNASNKKFALDTAEEAICKMIDQLPTPRSTEQQVVIDALEQYRGRSEAIVRLRGEKSDAKLQLAETTQTAIAATEALIRQARIDKARALAMGSLANDMGFLDDISKKLSTSFRDSDHLGEQLTSHYKKGDRSTVIAGIENLLVQTSSLKSSIDGDRDRVTHARDEATATKADLENREQGGEAGLDDAIAAATLRVSHLDIDLNRATFGATSIDALHQQVTQLKQDAAKTDRSKPGRKEIITRMVAIEQQLIRIVSGRVQSGFDQALNPNDGDGAELRAALIAQMNPVVVAPADFSDSVSLTTYPEELALAWDQVPEVFHHGKIRAQTEAYYKYREAFDDTDKQRVFEGRRGRFEILKDEARDLLVLSEDEHMQARLHTFITAGSASSVAGDSASKDAQHDAYKGMLEDLEDNYDFAVDLGAHFFEGEDVAQGIDAIKDNPTEQEMHDFVIGGGLTEVGTGRSGSTDSQQEQVFNTVTGTVGAIVGVLQIKKLKESNDEARAIHTGVDVSADPEHKVLVKLLEEDIARNIIEMVDKGVDVAGCICRAIPLMGPAVETGFMVKELFGTIKSAIIAHLRVVADQANAHLAEVEGDILSGALSGSLADQKRRHAREIADSVSTAIQTVGTATQIATEPTAVAIGKLIRGVGSFLKTVSKIVTFVVDAALAAKLDNLRKRAQPPLSDPDAQEKIFHYGYAESKGLIALGIREGNPIARNFINSRTTGGGRWTGDAYAVTIGKSLMTESDLRKCSLEMARFWCMSVDGQDIPDQDTVSSRLQFAKRDVKRVMGTELWKLQNKWTDRRSLRWALGAYTDQLTRSATDIERLFDNYESIQTVRASISSSQETAMGMSHLSSLVTNVVTNLGEDIDGYYDDLLIFRSLKAKFDPNTNEVTQTQMNLAELALTDTLQKINIQANYLSNVSDFVSTVETKVSVIHSQTNALLTTLTDDHAAQREIVTNSSAQIGTTEAEILTIKDEIERLKQVNPKTPEIRVSVSTQRERLKDANSTLKTLQEQKAQAESKLEKLLENADDLDKTQTLLKLITAPVSALKDSMTLAYAAYNNLKGAAL